MTNYTKDDTIFVQIASYRDPELQHTLQDLFKKAKRPENITVGICHQYDMKGDEDKHLFEVPFPNPKQLRIDEVDYRDAKGCCWARNRVQKLYKDEKWTLMIDSHMRFEEGWDEICVEITKQLQKQHHEKIILSTYVCSYESDGSVDKYVSNTKAEFEKDGTPKSNGAIRIDLKNPAIAGFFCAHFCFGTAKIIEDVEYDPLVYFMGEEISKSVRYWTLGYDIFVPDKIIAYHLYREIKGEKKINRNISTEDDLSWQERDKISRSRVKHFLKVELSNDDLVTKNLDNHSLGYKRSLRDYERFSGIDFRKRRTREYSKQGIFEEWKNTSSSNMIYNVFDKIDIHE